MYRHHLLLPPRLSLSPLLKLRLPLRLMPATQPLLSTITRLRKITVRSDSVDNEIGKQLIVFLQS
jgi:hypothetical protein